MDLEGAEALDRLWVALRNAFPDRKERTAFALYWVDTWGVHYNDDQFDGRVRWWATQVHDDDLVLDADGSHPVAFGRTHYRRLADAAVTALV